MKLEMKEGAYSIWGRGNGCWSSGLAASGSVVAALWAMIGFCSVWFIFLGRAEQKGRGNAGI
ncbi:hypothetical protein BJX64DRAFT_249193 [Aspergillus heterothallicus]